MKAWPRWRPRSPTICKLEASGGGGGSHWRSSSLTLKTEIRRIRADAVNPSLKAQEKGALVSQGSSNKRAHLSFLRFCFILVLRYWREWSSLILLIQVLISLETPSQTCPGIMYQLSRLPLAPSSWHTKLTIKEYAWESWKERIQQTKTAPWTPL